MKSSKKWKREKNNAPDSISITIDPSDDRTETQNPLTEKDLEIEVQRSEKRFVNLVKQDPGKARQNS